MGGEERRGEGRKGEGDISPLVMPRGEKGGGGGEKEEGATLLCALVFCSSITRS
jgi:hypothetical protein